ncbi:MAG: hypothetical protein WCD69_15165 [Xanthobacteraceae bacterium]
MRATDTSAFVLAAALAVLPAGRALPQMQPVDETHTVQQTYDVETWGAFRNIMMSGDFIGRVRLDAVMARHPTTGVGALAELGEITICDGRLIVSYGKVPPAKSASERAALLATARVDGWQGVPVENDVPPNEIESFIAVAARTHGIDPTVSFPFEVQGNIGPYDMHVNQGPTNGEHGMDMPMAVTVQDKGDRLDGVVAGLYASLDLMGIATHGGERTHSHWVSPDMIKTAHLDRWGLRAGAFLPLPKP